MQHGDWLAESRGVQLEIRTEYSSMPWLIVESLFQGLVDRVGFGEFHVKIFSVNCRTSFGKRGQVNH